MGLFGIALFAFASGISPYARLGYPLIPGVFGYYMTLAFLVSLTTRSNTVLALLFFIGIILSGSRSALMFACAVALILGLSRTSGNRARIMIALLGLSILIGYFIIDLEAVLRPFLVERADVTAGRLVIWAEAINRIADSPVLGYGYPQVIAVLDSESELAAHNSFIDLSLTYGLIYAVSAYAIWFGVFVPTHSPGAATICPRNSQMLQRLKVALFGLIIFKSLVSTTFWTNMGDAGTLFAILVLLLPADQNVYVRTRRHPAKVPVG
jgi:O-antigen ligase